MPTHPQRHASDPHSARGRVPSVGAKVRIERDERRWPSKGTWPRFRGRTGTVVEINAGEIGVAFGTTTNPRRRDAWFQPHEVTVLSAP